MNRIAKLAATVLGIGYFPFAPGTLASLVALVPAWFILRFGGPTSLGAAGIASMALGIWACGVHVRATGNLDPSECVIDEVAGQWIACALSPCSIPGFALAFALFRIFDIAKFWPMSRLEQLPGGYGVMLDDVAAGLLAGVIVAGIQLLGVFR